MEPAILANTGEVCDYLELTEAASRCSFEIKQDSEKLIHWICLRQKYNRTHYEI